MKITFDVKPKRQIGSNKDSLVDLITRGLIFNYHSPSGSFYSSIRDPKMITVFNLQKLNKKTKQKKIALKEKTNGYDNVTISTIIRRKMWVAYVYDIPLEAIKLTGLKINQNNRNFTVTSK